MNNKLTETQMKKLNQTSINCINYFLEELNFAENETNQTKFFKLSKVRN